MSKQKKSLSKGTTINKSADIFGNNGDVVVVSHGKEVFRKPKTPQTVAIAHCIYMANRYESKTEEV